MKKKQDNIKPIHIQIGKRLKAIRQREKLSQEKFAERIGVSRDFYSNVEKGMNTLNEETYVRASKEFDVSIDFIITGKVNKGVECAQYLQSLEPIEKFETCMDIMLSVCGETNRSFSDVVKTYYNKFKE